MFRILLVLAVALGALGVPPRGESVLKQQPPQSDLAQARGIVNAGQLKGLCTSAENAGDALFETCLGYLAGSLDQLVAQDGASGRSARRLCPGGDISLGEFRLLFLQYMDLNPDLELAAAAPVVERAVVPSLSCNVLRLPYSSK